MDFSIEEEFLSLEELSAIAVASQFWDLPTMKMELKKFLDKYYPNWHKKALCYEKKSGRTYWSKFSPKISMVVLKRLNDLNVPIVLQKKIKRNILKMSKHLFCWIMNLIQNMELDLEYVQKIYWTSNGRIDEDKIFQFYWKNFPVHKAFSEERFDRKLKPLYYLACLFAQEEFLTTSLTDVAKEINSIIPLEIHNEFDVMKLVISYYDKYPILNGLNCSEAKKQYILSTTNTQVLDICLSLCLHKAFVSFWKHLDTIERYNYVEKKSKCYLWSSVEVNYGAENFFQIFLFLMNEMNSTQSSNFIRQNFNKLFIMFLGRVSFQKFCIPLLDKFLPILSKNRIKLSLLSFVHTLKPLTQTNKDFHLQILKHFLEKIPTAHKKLAIYAVLEDTSSRSVFNTFDIPVLKLIISDKDLKYQDLIIDWGQEKYKDLIRGNNFELLNEFLVLIFEKRRHKFKQNYNFLYEWIEAGQFDTADKVLYWMHGDQAHKHKIGVQPFGISSLLKNADLIHKFMKWYFEIQEEPLIRHCDDNTKITLKDFCRESIYRIWFIHNTDNINISTKILTTVFGSDEDILNFKINELAKGESCVRVFLDQANLYGPEPNFDQIDRFLNFCSLNKEEIDGIKKLIAHNINDWMVQYGVNGMHFRVLVPLLEWVYGNSKYNFRRLKYHFQAHHDELVSYYTNRTRLS